MSKLGLSVCLSVLYSIHCSALLITSSEQRTFNVVDKQQATWREDKQTTKDKAKSVNKIDVFSQRNSPIFLLLPLLLLLSSVLFETHKMGLHIKHIDQQPNEAD